MNFCKEIRICLNDSAVWVEYETKTGRVNRVAVRDLSAGESLAVHFASAVERWTENEKAEKVRAIQKAERDAETWARLLEGAKTSEGAEMATRGIEDAQARAKKGRDELDALK